MPVGHAPLHHKLSHLLQSACSKLPLYFHTTYPLSQSQFSQIMSGHRRISMSFAKRLHSRMGIDANLILDYARNAPRQSMAWSRGFPCLQVSDRWSQGECWCTRQPALVWQGGVCSLAAELVCSEGWIPSFVFSSWHSKQVFSAHGLTKTFSSNAFMPDTSSRSSATTCGRSLNVNSLFVILQHDPLVESCCKGTPLWIGGQATFW